MLKGEALNALLAEELGSSRGRGRPSIKGPLVMTHKRDLGPEDLAALKSRPPSALPKPADTITQLRHSHHLVARLVAEGKRPFEIAAQTGYSPGRISQLQAYPDFKELVEFYKNQVEAQYISMHERLANLGIATIEELQNRIEDPELAKRFANKDMVEMFKSVLDRSVTPGGRPAGTGPGTLPGGAAPSITINFVSPEAKPANGSGLTIDITPEPER